MSAFPRYGALAGALLAAGTASAATAPTVLTHTGYLAESGTEPRTGVIPMRFQIWQQADTTAPALKAWEASCNVAVTRGYYSVLLGAAPAPGGCGSGLTTDMLPPGATRWLDVVADGVAMSPRLRISPVPAATIASLADDAERIDGLDSTQLLRADAAAVAGQRVTFNGGATFAAGTVSFNQATGAAPFAVSSTTRVANLNADLLDDLHASSFLRSDTDTSTAGNLNTNGKIRERGADLVPRGLVAMWSGTLATLPAGWALCNGGTYVAPDGALVTTPDLRGRFLYGAGAGENPGGTGGAATHNHVYTGVPYHTHGVSDPGHRHWIASAPRDDGNGSGLGTANQRYGLYADAGAFTGVADQWGWPYGSYDNYAGTGVSVNYAGSTTNNTQDASSLPPFFKVAFIMKL